ncbi:hypothetical protein AB0J21_29620 [Streptomyces sp. NPDC049954]|uniref:toxin-antitoxin system YwqK family antitoxin n=1 Tax=Streptomyces sp. NPDC049954 TaxID=3155779 RepID=UPI0034350138
MLRVDADDSGIDMEGSSIVTYRGEPFTGELVEHYPDGRQLWNLTTYADGLEDGPQREWYPDGTLKSEGRARPWAEDDPWRTYHPNGVLAEELELDVVGRRKRRVRWNDEGQLIGEEQG